MATVTAISRPHLSIRRIHAMLIASMTLLVVDINMGDARDRTDLPRYNLVMIRIDSPATELRESMMAVTRQMRRHRPDHGLTLSQMELLGEVSRTGVTTPAELANRLHVRVQSLTDSINELVSRDLVARRPDETDRRRQLIELTEAGTALLEVDRAERDAWLHATMRDNLTPLEFDLLMLVAPVLRKLAYTDAKAGTLAV